ncbi:MAG: hypothetical protein JNJ73_00545 [Hyphomonadaceae bacterium]|nr:hypothetical protein [Hyphomonadaceae bacterium]
MGYLDVARDALGAVPGSPAAMIGLALLGIGGIAYLALRGQGRIAALVCVLAGLGAFGWFGWQAWPAATARRAHIAEAANERVARSPEVARALGEKIAEIETGRVAEFVRNPPAGLEVVSADPAQARIELRTKLEVRCKPGGEAKRAMLRIAAPEGFRVIEPARLQWLGGERPRADGNIAGGIGPIIYRNRQGLGTDGTDTAVAEAEMYCQSLHVRIAFLGPDAWTSWELSGAIVASVTAEERARLLREVVARADPALRERARAEAEAEAPSLAEWMRSGAPPPIAARPPPP